VGHLDAEGVAAALPREARVDGAAQAALLAGDRLGVLRRPSRTRSARHFFAGEVLLSGICILKTIK
jgi:hypothetical protein